MIDPQTIERCYALNARMEDLLTWSIGADCQLTLELGFFFDGMQRNIEEDLQEGRVSNIGNLFSAFPGKSRDQEGHVFRAIYISGLGTTFNTTLEANFEGAIRRAHGDAQGTLEGHVRGSAIEAAGEALDEVGGRWWEVFGRSWKASLTKPWEWIKSARDAAVRTGAEALGPIRDHPLTANLLMSGAATRQAAAISQFRGAVQDASRNSQMPLGTIRISVFGFDFGAALAKAFVRELLQEVCELKDERYYFGDAEVQVVFAGLFDCVDRTHPELGPVDWFHPLTPVLDDGGSLHPGCRRALHLIAAHERRFYRRCRPLGPLQANWREILQPGISEDIGGGLKPDEQKVSAELSRVALHRMYRSAMAAGVPFPSLEELQTQDVFTSRFFELNDKVNDYSLMALHRHYERLARNSLSPNETHFRQHAELYLAWLAHRYRKYIAAREELEEILSALPDFTPSGVLGVPTTSLAVPVNEWQAMETTAEETEQAIEQLDLEWGWLEEVDQEARQIRTLFLSGSSMTQRQARYTLEHEYRMAEAWWQWTRKTEPPATPEEVELLFAYGLHDKRPEEQRRRNRQDSTLTGGYHFFTWRRLDLPA